jgi:hypothetical protein
MLPAFYLFGKRKTQNVVHILRERLFVVEKIMRKKIVVEKEKFDAVLSQLLKARPVPMKSIKTTGKRPKGTVIPKQSES